MTEETFRVVLVAAGQALTVFAFVGTFLYAALQFRGWRTAQHVANFTKLVELQLQLRSMNVNDPTLAALDGAYFGPGASPEEVRAYFYNLMQLSRFEIAWFSHKHRQLDEGYFQSWESNMTSIVKRPSFGAMWHNDRTKILDNRFRSYVDALIDCRSRNQPVRI
ncbi:MAG: hypothetical protein ND895_20725 [Pyrinomonadaceae bacterium]|nr:hypothetical protein [Pyrinomonadaceae bacterium]